MDDAIQSTNITKDKQFMIDVAALRQGVEQREYAVAWQAGTEILADPLTKKNANPNALREVLESGQVDVIF